MQVEISSGLCVSSDGPNPSGGRRALRKRRTEFVFLARTLQEESVEVSYWCFTVIVLWNWGIFGTNCTLRECKRISSIVQARSEGSTFYFFISRESAGTERILLEFYKPTLLKKHENTWWLIGVLLVESLLSLDSSCSCSAWPPHCWTPVAALCHAAWSRHELRALSSGGKEWWWWEKVESVTLCKKQSFLCAFTKSHPLIIIFACKRSFEHLLVSKADSWIWEGERRAAEARKKQNKTKSLALTNSRGTSSQEKVRGKRLWFI